MAKDNIGYRSDNAPVSITVLINELPRNQHWLHFAVAREEGNYRALVGLTSSQKMAERMALAAWDDALPNNHVYVYEHHSIEGRWTCIGHAESSGDGGSEWSTRSAGRAG